MTIGTNGNDTLTIEADFDLVSALGGDDEVTSTFDGTHMLCGMGNLTLGDNADVLDLGPAWIIDVCYLRSRLDEWPVRG